MNLIRKRQRHMTDPFPFKEKKVLPSQEEFYIYSHSRIFDDTEQGR